MKSLLKETLFTFITIPGSLSHIHLKTSKIEDKNVVKLNNTYTCLTVGVNGALDGRSLNLARVKLVIFEVFA